MVSRVVLHQQGTLEPGGAIDRQTKCIRLGQTSIRKHVNIYTGEHNTKEESFLLSPTTGVELLPPFVNQHFRMVYHRNSKTRKARFRNPFKINCNGSPFLQAVSVSTVV